MDESYSERESPAAREARALLSLLLPDADPALLEAGLRAERAGGAPAPPGAAQEVARVRARLRLGESARVVQHAMNNPLTALLAEAQLLEMEALTEDQRQSV